MTTTKEFSSRTEEGYVHYADDKYENDLEGERVRVRVRMSTACHDPDFDPAKESHQMALTLKVFVQVIRKSQM
jgi:hypothetical protein